MTVLVQSTPLLLEVAPEIDTKPTNFYRGRRRRGVGPVKVRTERGKFAASIAHPEAKRFSASEAGPNPFCVRRTSCYRRRTTFSVREDKVCPPSLSKSSDKACNQTGTHFHCYNLQKHLYVVICIFTRFTVSACYCMVGLINITYFVDSESKPVWIVKL